MANLQSSKAGYLFLKRRGDGAAKSGLKKWKKRWVVLQKGSPLGHVRLEHYESEEHAMNGKGRTVIDLQKAVSVDEVFSKSQKHAFEITFSDHSLLCAVASDTEMREWRARLSILLFSQVGLDLGDPEVLKKVPEPTEPFPVRISRTESSVAACLEGNYFLDVTSDDRITLAPSVSGQQSAEWLLRHVRNFVLLPVKGGGNVLVMETGRRSSTGVGSFQFLTSQGEYLYAYIRARTYRIPRSPCLPRRVNNVQPVGPNSAPDLPPRRSPMILARPVSAISQFNEHSQSDSNLQNVSSHGPSLPTVDFTEISPDESSSIGPNSGDLYYDSPRELTPRIHVPPAIRDSDKYTTMNSNPGVISDNGSDSGGEVYDDDDTPVDIDNKFFDPSAEDLECNTSDEEGKGGEDEVYVDDIDDDAYEPMEM